MKRLFRKTKGLIRGTSSAVILSIMIHGGLLLLATGLVVFHFVKPQDTKFVPKKIDRPQMQLKKLIVKVKETAKPRKTTQRITSSRRTTAMPDIQLPAMTDMGSNLGSIGGFEMMADLSTMTILGGGRSVGNDLEGTFYYFRWGRNGNPIPGMTVSTDAFDPSAFVLAINNFLVDWSPRVWDEFYRAPSKLYATQLMVPPAKSYTAPSKFGIKEASNPEFQSCLWAIHYKGKIANKLGGRFRFWGFGDDIFYIRLDGKIVLNASHSARDQYKDPDNWQSTAKETRQYILGSSRARIGDWFTLEPGVPIEMEALICEVPGGTFTMMLLVEEEGVDYPENEDGMPILPIFKTMVTPPHLIDEIKYLMVQGQADLEGGPIFSVY